MNVQIYSSTCEILGLEQGWLVEKVREVVDDVAEKCKQRKLNMPEDLKIDIHLGGYPSTVESGVLILNLCNSLELENDVIKDYSDTIKKANKQYRMFEPDIIKNKDKLDQFKRPYVYDFINFKIDEINTNGLEDKAVKVYEMIKSTKFDEKKLFKTIAHDTGHLILSQSSVNAKEFRKVFDKFYSHSEHVIKNTALELHTIYDWRAVEEGLCAARDIILRNSDESDLYDRSLWVYTDFTPIVLEWVGKKIDKNLRLDKKKLEKLYIKSGLVRLEYLKKLTS